MATNKVDDKVKELEKDLKENNTENVITEGENNKFRKIITIALKGIAVVATGVIGFFIGRGTASNGNDDEGQEENTTTEE